MSVTVLSIEVKLERGEPDNKIKVYVKDPYNKEIDKTIELNDDDETSFKSFTDNLAPLLTTLHSILPHKSKDFFKSTADKEAAAEEIKKTQKTVLGEQIKGEPVTPTSSDEIIPSDETCEKVRMNGVDKTMITNLQKLIVDNRKDFNKEFVKISVRTFLEGQTIDEPNIIKSLSHLDCASYLGEHDLKGEKSKVFMTKDGILTNGIIILPFKLDEKGNIPLVDNYDRMWKLYEEAGVIGASIRTRYGIEGETMYDIAVSLLKKYKTYEISDITFVFDTTNSVTFMTNTPLKQDVEEDMKNKITKLIEASETQKPDDKAIKEQIDSLFKSNNETNERLKDYCISIVSDQSTEYLGRWTINTIPNQHIFLTKDGIITDGYAILPFQIDEKDGKPSDPIGLFRPYVTLWKIPHTDGTSPEFRSEYDAAVVKMKTSHKYGGSKTSSQRPIKTKSTRRIRPRKTKI